MKKIYGILGLGVAALVVAAVAAAGQPPAKTFVAVLTADQEAPPCAAATNASRGVFVAHVTDEATGTVRWKLVANNLPGDIVAAHIHLGPKGSPGPVVQPTLPTVGEENGVVGTGTFSNPALVAAIRADPDAYYVNVHTTVCPPGAIRGQLGDHGPSNK